MAERFIVKLESYEGVDTFLRCGGAGQDYLYCVVGVDPDGQAEIVDNGYRSIEEALGAWPEIGPQPLAS